MTFKKGLALSANRDLVKYLATSYENKGNSMCLYFKSLSGGITETHTHTLKTKTKTRRKNARITHLKFRFKIPQFKYMTFMYQHHIH